MIVVRKSLICSRGVSVESDPEIRPATVGALEAIDSEGVEQVDMIAVGRDSLHSSNRFCHSKSAYLDL